MSIIYYLVSIVELPSASFEAIDADTGLYYYYDTFGNQIIELTSDDFHYIIRQEITPYLPWMVGYTGIPLETNPIKPSALFKNTQYERLSSI